MKQFMRDLSLIKGKRENFAQEYSCVILEKN